MGPFDDLIPGAVGPLAGSGGSATIPMAPAPVSPFADLVPNQYTAAFKAVAPPAPSFEQWLTTPPAALTPAPRQVVPGSPLDNPVGRFSQGAAQSVVQGAASLTSPLGIGTIGLGGLVAPLRTPLAALFGALGAKNVGQAAGTLAGTPHPTPEQYGQATGDIGQGLLMGLSPFADLVPRSTTTPQAPNVQQRVASLLDQLTAGGKPSARPVEATVPPTQQAVAPTPPVPQPQAVIPINTEVIPPVQPPAVSLPKEVTPLRQDVEGQKDFLHGLNNIASQISALPESQRGAFRQRADTLFQDVQAGKKTPQVAQAELDAFSKDLKTRTTAPKEDLEATMRELEAEGFGKAEVPEPVAEAPRLLDDPKKLGLAPNKEGRFNTQQLLGTLRNKLHPSEYDMLKSQGIEKAFGPSVTKEEAATWLEKNSPKVEVRKFGEGGQTSETNEFNDLTHNWYDRLTPEEQGVVNLIQRGDGLSKEGKEAAAKLDQIKLNRYVQLAHGPRAEGGNAAHWSSVAPKTEQDMPGYVEGAVVLPQTKEQIRAIEEGPLRAAPDRALFPSSHSFPPNTLGFFRGYMETLPNGKKVFHVIEVQSDWAQRVRQGREDGMYQEGGMSVTRTGVPDHPLLSQYERLTLKAAIDHAKEQGADAIAVQDAESAMMMEGHDRAAKQLIQPSKENIDAARKEIDRLEKLPANQKGGYKYHLDALYDFVENGRPLNATAVREELRMPFTSEAKVEQEPGMRLHYDKTLPRTLGELTGTKGEKVGFGEHRMAFSEAVQRNLPNIEHLERIPEAERYRKDLIFQEGGKPKTSITATMFPLDKVKEQFSLFGRDKPVAEQAAPEVAESAVRLSDKTGWEGAKAGLPALQQRYFDALKLGPDSTAHSALQSMAAQPELFGREKSALALFLMKSFPEALRDTKLFAESSPTVGRATFAPAEQRIYLGLDSSPNSVPFKVLHEAAHAATYWQFENPRTAVQLRASETIRNVMQQSIEKLPQEVRDNIGKQTWGMEYYHSNEQEFIAGIFSSGYLRDHLAAIPAEGGTMWTRAWNAVLDLLHVKRGSALEQSLSALAEVGQERGRWQDNRAAYYGDRMSSGPAEPFYDGLDRIVKEVPEPTQEDEQRRVVPVSMVETSIKARLAKWAGKSAPRTVTANEDVGNALVRYASAREAGPRTGHWLATEVLGPRYKDEAYDILFGAALTEDRLRALKSTLQQKASEATENQAELQAKADAVVSIIGRESPIRTEEQFQRLLQNPEFQQAIERHKQMVQPLAQQMHEALGGELSQPGEETGAFVNLVAMLAPDDVESTRSFVFGSKQGDLTNPLKRGSSFGKEFKGTAEQYELSYRKLAERMIRGNYEQYALRQYYDKAVAAGLAFEDKPGVRPPQTSKGESFKKTTVEIKGAGPGMTKRLNFWLRPDLYDEFRQATAVDSPLRKGAMQLLLDGLTEAQVVGPTDIAWHGVNQLAVLAGSQGAGPVWYDIVRKGVPPVGLVDAFVRMSYEGLKAYNDNPETQKIMAELSQIGAGRAEPVHRGGVVTRTLQKVGVPESAARAVDVPGRIAEVSSKVMRILDTGGRVTANKFFDEMVRRGWYQDTELDRREFVNQMGQYNARLMSKWESLARESSLSSFVVAGKNMNRNAVRRLFTLQAARAMGPDSAAKMRAVELLALASTMFALPMTINYFNTGKASGRPGTPFGMIDTGKDDKQGRPVTIDLLQMNLTRRALRITGTQAAMTGTDEKLGVGETGQAMFRDFAAGQLHPWMGPSARFGYTVASGREPSVPVQQGYLLSKNPDSLAENVYAAVRNSNPTMSQFFKEGAEGKSVPSKLLGSLPGALGFKTGRFPSFQQQYDERVKQLGHEPSIVERRQITQEIEQQKAAKVVPENLASLAAGEKDYWRNVQQRSDLYKALPTSHREWLTAHNLKLPGFATEITLRGVRIPSTKLEGQQQKDQEIVAYSQAIGTLMKIPNFDHFDHDLQQKLLDRQLTAARAKVRGGAVKAMVLPRATADSQPVQP